MNINEEGKYYASMVRKFRKMNIIPVINENDTVTIDELLRKTSRKSLGI